MAGAEGAGGAGGGGIGLVTIGTTPRPDLLAVFGPSLPPGTPIALKGALDGLSDEAIHDLTMEVSPGPYPLLCRLADRGRCVARHATRTALQPTNVSMAAVLELWPKHSPTESAAAQKLISGM